MYSLSTMSDSNAPDIELSFQHSSSVVRPAALNPNRFDCGACAVVRATSIPVEQSLRDNLNSQE
jgi:hypothetical protein